MVIYFNAFYEPSRFADHMLTSGLLSAFAARDMAAFPPLNISEDAESVVIRALIPGATLDDVEIMGYARTLSIKNELVPIRGRYSLQERPVGRFQRLVDLGFEPDPELLSASMRNGVLRIVLSKPGKASAKHSAVHKGKAEANRANRAKSCGGRDVVRPTMDVIEREEGFFLYLNLPGVEKSDLRVESLSRELVIDGCTSYGLEDCERLHNLEFSDVRYHSKLTLPEDVDRNAIKAELRDGVLTVFMPRRVKEPERIAIKVT